LKVIFYSGSLDNNNIFPIKHYPIDITEIYYIIKTNYKKNPYFFFVIDDNGKRLDNDRVYFINAIPISQIQAMMTDSKLFNLMREKEWRQVATFKDGGLYYPINEDNDKLLQIN